MKLWSIPDGGLTETMTDPLATLNGHAKDVTLVQWHPTASNVLASASREMKVRLWDVEHCADRLEIAGFGGLISDVRWSYKGDLLATSCKDKMVRIFDPRASAETPISEVQAHEGAKVVNMTFLGRRELLLTAGFMRTSRREFKVWDPRKMDEPVAKQELDQSAGVLMPFWDDDSNILYMGGKGDGNVRYYEILEEGGGTNIYPVSEIKATESTKGLAMLPKRTVDVGRCETARFVKLLRDKAHVISFTVPRKGDRFQDDLYPDTTAPTPSTSAEAWFGGATPEPKRMSMNPELNGGMTHASEATTIKSTGKSAAEVAGAAAAADAPAPAAAGASASASGDATAEIATLKARVAELEGSVASLKREKDAAVAAAAASDKAATDAAAAAAAAATAASSSGAGDAAGGGEDAERVAALTEENDSLKAQVAKLKKAVASLTDM